MSSANRLPGAMLTEDHVRTLTRDILQARAAADTANSQYLQGLVHTVQVELGVTPRVNPVKVQRLTDEGIQLQLTALRAVHTRAYAVVLEVCAEHLLPGKDRAKELNRRSNFARTAFGVVRRWIRSGRDITCCAAAKVSKGSLRVEVDRTRAPSPRALTRRVEKGVTELIERATALAAIDKAAGVAQLETALSKIVTTLSAIGGPQTTTKDPAKALAEHIPFETKQGVFYPALSRSQRISS